MKQGNLQYDQVVPIFLQVSNFTPVLPHQINLVATDLCVKRFIDQRKIENSGGKDGCMIQAR